MTSILFICTSFVAVVITVDALHSIRIRQLRVQVCLVFVLLLCSNIAPMLVGILLSPCTRSLAHMKTKCRCNISTTQWEITKITRELRKSQHTFVILVFRYYSFFLVFIKFWLTTLPEKCESLWCRIKWWMLELDEWGMEKDKQELCIYMCWQALYILLKRNVCTHKYKKEIELWIINSFFLKGCVEL